MDNIRKLVVFEQLKVGPVQILPNKASALYELVKPGGEKVSNEMVFSYEENVFTPEEPESQNLASMAVVQVALNYGLFCKEIVFDGLFDETDRRFIIDMMENTSREIWVNKFLFPNEFLKEGYKKLRPEKQKRYTAAKITFVNSQLISQKLKWKHWENEKSRFAILSSGGKDSLLSYGLLKELHKDIYPVFINESGRHWFTALNAYRHLKENEPNTGRVWCNSDRIFSWMLRQMPFIREDFAKVKADMYPVRLWTVAVFLFGVLPVARKRKAGRILIGDEYDTTIRTQYEGITHYNELYDQSRYFDNYLTRFYMKKGWNFQQFSILRSLSEMLIVKILVKRYPHLQQHQISCHASHERDKRIYPCGNCEKCRRIVGMLKALEEDPGRCGYNPAQITQSLQSFAAKKVKQIGSDAQHLFYLLFQKELIEKNEHTRKMAKPHDYIMKLRFDNEKSLLSDIPFDIRHELLTLYLQYAEGAVRYKNRKWEDFNLWESTEIDTPYPFEISSETSNTSLRPGKHDYLWENMSWPEIQERLQHVDTAILPCGAIEQHGPHLPVDIDYFDVWYLSRKVAEACSAPRPFVLPAIPYGVSYHHDEFKGTLSVTNEALSRFIYDIGMNLARNGIRKLIILNGHGDNAPTLNFAAQMINRDANIFVCVESGETSDHDINSITETPNDIHAGEIETSTSLVIRPGLIDMDKAADATLTFGSSYLDFTSARGVPWYVRTKKITESGVMGDPTKATAEKGQKIWEMMIAHLVKFVEEIKNSNLEELYQKRY